MRIISASIVFYEILFCLSIPKIKRRIPLNAFGLRTTTIFTHGLSFHQNLQRLRPATINTAATTIIASLYGNSAATTIPSANAAQTVPLELNIKNHRLTYSSSLRSIHYNRRCFISLLFLEFPLFDVFCLLHH